MIDVNCAVAAGDCTVRGQAGTVTRPGCTLHPAVVGTRPAEHILKVANSDFSEICDRCNRLTAIPHAPDDALQVHKVAHSLPSRILADVLSHLVESRTLPNVDCAQPLQQNTNRGGVVRVGERKARTFLVRPPLRLYYTLARP